MRRKRIDQRNTREVDTARSKRRVAKNEFAYTSRQHEEMPRHMKRRPRQQKKLKRQRKGGGHFKTVMMLLGITLFLCVCYFGSKAYIALQNWENKSEQSDFKAGQAGFRVSSSKPIEVEDNIINVAVFATDEDGFRTDVDMLVTFNTSTKSLNIISVPRDTRVTLTSEMISFLEKNGRTVPTRNGVYGQCKMTEVHAYAGEGNRNAFSVAMMEKILGVEIDYYLKVDLSAFREIVDAVGGVDMYVPQNMYWDMTDTGGPLINLREGMQHLDGKKAEQLVRFRDGYAQKDIMRIQVQQEFIRAFMEKVLNTQSLVGNISSLIEIILDKTESNITIAQALQYVKYIPDVKLDEVQMMTIPTLVDPGSYYDHDPVGTKAMVDEFVYGIVAEENVGNVEE